MSKKVSVTLTDEQFEAVERAVAEGEAESASSFVAAAVAEKCGVPGRQKKPKRKQAVSLRELLEQWDEELGPPSAEAEAWAEEQIGRLLGRAKSA